MYQFSQRSLRNLTTCQADLQKLSHAVMDLQLFDFGISHGYRGQEAQDQLYFEGRSKLIYPQSKHNTRPSSAFDFVLYVNGKVNWNSANSWYMAVGVFRGIAPQLGIKIRCGADWDNDFDTRDQTFHDLGHIELIKE